jgi:threonine aldolase
VTSRHKSFGSDNHAGAHPAIIAALAAANAGDAVAYGGDALTAEVQEFLRAAFGAQDAAFVFNGTGANVLGLSLMLRPFEAVICAESSHLNADECGAAERILGSKLLLVDAPDGKLTPGLIASRLQGRGDEHRVQARAVELAQATEVGTCYTLAELGAIRDFCRANELLIYIDGARLANAAAYLDCSLAELAAHADVISFGGTKNGAVGAEAVLVMNARLAAELKFQRKQLMQLASKMRFLSAQFAALLDGDLWLHSARHANAMARRLAAGLQQVPGIRLAYPVQANGVFAVLPGDQIAELRKSWSFHVWDDAGHSESVTRWMAAFDTTEAHVDELIEAMRTTSLVAQRVSG